MENNVKQVVDQVAEVPRKPRSFYGPGKYKWVIYPDYWKNSWGQKPVLGIVYADDEFCAEREAYNRGLLTFNFTIKPFPVKIGVAKPRQPRTYIKGEQQ